MPIPPSRSSPAFSVLELCVALALAAILAVFLNSVLAKTRTANRQALDPIHLRQIGVTLNLYITDHQQRLPAISNPVPVKTLAQYLGYIHSTNDWSNDSSTPKNSIFKPAANQRVIRQLFTSGYDDRDRPDPLNSFATNSYIGSDPNEVGSESARAERWNEIVNPGRKIYMIPARFIATPYHTSFSGSSSFTFFRSGNAPDEKSRFPALFVDGHTEMFDPYLSGTSLNDAHRRWLRPKDPKE
ncbi:MAG TPA: hypothetical protein VNQ90_01995 [Chthoniobacteraceae bacterium]|nr:hypothetical protein [Chthoniobacteraceae bacterium]